MKNNTTIQVLGSGCPSCKRLFETTRQAVETMGLDAEVEYITDIQKIIDMGVMQSPVLAVDGTAIMAGSVPNKDQIIELLERNLSE